MLAYRRGELDLQLRETAPCPFNLCRNVRVKMSSWEIDEPGTVFSEPATGSTEITLRVQGAVCGAMKANKYPPGAAAIEETVPPRSNGELGSGARVLARRGRGLAACTWCHARRAPPAAWPRCACTLSAQPLTGKGPTLQGLSPNTIPS